MENLQLSYPGYYLVIISLVAVCFALFLYYRDRRIKENKSWLPKVLGILRFLSILGILFLLLTPLIKRFIMDKQDPVVVILKDESGSIKSTTSSETLLQLDNSLASLEQALQGSFDLKQISFGENIAVQANDTISPSSTNISQPIDYVTETFSDENLGAVILLSDGIYNEGVNPLYSELPPGVPIYTIGLGDTTIRKDLLIRNVLHNRIVYLKDKFRIEVDLQAYNAKGQTTRVQLSQTNGGKKSRLDAKSITIDEDNFFETVSFELEANSIGNVKYIVEVDKVTNEVSLANNARNIYIEVLDARQQILLLAHAPHPDIKALKRSIESNLNFELDIKFAKDETPTIGQYDIVIMHDLPSTKYPVSRLISDINRTKKPIMYITGNNTDLVRLNSNQDVLKVRGYNNSMNEVTPIVSADFDLFTIDDKLKNDLRSFIPLSVPFGEYELGPTAVPLMKQKIGQVETLYPLLAYSDLNSHRQAVLTGEGIWRWRLYEFQEYDEHSRTESLINKSLQYISQKADKRQFRAYVSKNSFKENESVSFDAQLYNENYEAINDPEAKLIIKNKAGESFDYTFSKTNNTYFIEAGRFPEGEYTFSASTNYIGKNLTASGKFSIQSIIKEQYDLTARHDILHGIAQKTNGSFYLPSDLSTLSEKLLSNDDIKPILFQKAETKPLLDSWWLLGLIIIFLAIEWFFRRYFGAY